MPAVFRFKCLFIKLFECWIDSWSFKALVGSFYKEAFSLNIVNIDVKIEELYLAAALLPAAQRQAKGGGDQERVEAETPAAARVAQGVETHSHHEMEVNMVLPSHPD